jgi:arylsulfatase A-like enzyme
MTAHAKTSRRRALLTATAGVTAAAVLAGLGFLATSGGPSAAASGQRSRTAIGDSLLPSATEPSGSSTDPSATADPSTSAETPVPADLSHIKNVVLVLADDLDWALFEQVPRLAALQDQGMTFTRQVVTDSLCCPSRVSIMRGEYVHNHGVVSNTEATGGGWPTFRNRQEQNDCLPVWLNNSGATTALFGKYLNEYPTLDAQTRAQRIRAAKVVPPGWDQWAVPISHGQSYEGYDYILNDNGRLRRYGSRPSAFLNDVITAKATDFLATAPEGFFLELSTFTPHRPSPVAPRNKDTHPATGVPRTPNYNTYGSDEPRWLQKIPTMGPRQLANADLRWRQRARSAESVADSVAAVQAQLKATGHDDDTLLIVTSDNGYHSVSHRMILGKRTAYREDTIVPMVMIGPGIPAGVRTEAMTSTIDLAPTILSLMGSQGPAWLDGRSLTGMMATGEEPSDWRTGVISESMGVSTKDDPDYEPQSPPPFSALHTDDWLFVSYSNGERELYDEKNDPYELHNLAKTADPALMTALYTQLQLLRACRGESCRAADTFTLPTPSASASPSTG